jgi:hypothetical protein
MSYNSNLQPTKSIVVVSSREHLPEALSNLITLEPNTTYIFQESLDLDEDTLVAQDNTVIMGVHPGVELTTSSPINGLIRHSGPSGINITISNIRLNSGLSDAIQGDVIAPGGTLKLHNVVFNECIGCGTLSDYASIIIEGCRFESCEGGINLGGTLPYIRVTGCSSTSPGDNFSLLKFTGFDTANLIQIFNNTLEFSPIGQSYLIATYDVSSMPAFKPYIENNILTGRNQSTYLYDFASDTYEILSYSGTELKNTLGQFSTTTPDIWLYDASTISFSSPGDIVELNSVLTPIYTSESAFDRSPTGFTYLRDTPVKCKITVKGYLDSTSGQTLTIIPELDAAPTTMPSPEYTLGPPRFFSFSGVVEFYTASILTLGIQSSTGDDVLISDFEVIIDRYI